MIGIGFAAGMTAAQKALRIMSAALIVIALLGLAYCQGRTDGGNAVKLKVKEAQIAAQEKQRKADEKAAKQREIDDQRIDDMEEAYDDAIAKAPGGANSPAARALACQRLRRAYPPDALQKNADFLRLCS